ncbi:MAG TPA: helix-turn-helix domain-containing protein, partial [Pirellulales bacterium]
ADLLYRLNGVTIFLPPLRERADDIPLLLQYFLTRARRDLDKPDLEGISPETLEILLNYSWPGNIRELQSVVRQAVLNSTGPVIAPEFLPADVLNPRRPAAGNGAAAAASDRNREGLPPSDLHAFVDARLKGGTTNLYAEALEMMERYVFTRVLQETKGLQTKAADVLGITRGKIRDRIAAFNISLNKSVSIDGNEEG